MEPLLPQSLGHQHSKGPGESQVKQAEVTDNYPRQTDEAQPISPKAAFNDRQTDNGDKNREAGTDKVPQCVPREESRTGETQDW